VATMFQKILCPIDFSDNSIAVLEQSAELARRFDALLYLMHVEFVRMNNPDELVRHASVSTETSERRLKRIAEDHLQNVRHHILLRSGWPGTVIEAVASELDVDLIVIATEGWMSPTHPLGNVAEHVVRAAKCAVLSFTFRARTPSFKRILCPIDFDANAVAALECARQLAQEHGAAIILLHVVEAGTAAQMPGAEAAPSEWESGIRHRLASVAQASLGSGASYELVALRGDPARAITEAATDLRSDLIVMATHGRTGLGYLLAGSVAIGIVRDSRVPVLTVRRRQ
jgi:nucleotide-binding universal stress UspA family protein